VRHQHQAHGRPGEGQQVGGEAGVGGERGEGVAAGGHDDGQDDEAELDGAP
jgi:hypothetical protein